MKRLQRLIIKELAKVYKRELLISIELAEILAKQTNLHIVDWRITYKGDEIDKLTIVRTEKLDGFIRGARAMTEAKAIQKHGA